MTSDGDDRHGAHVRTTVAIVTSSIGAAGLVIAAIIGVDAKHDRDSLTAALAVKDAQLADLQRQALGGPSSADDSLNVEIARLRNAVAERDFEIRRLSAAVPVQGSVPQPITVRESPAAAPAQPAGPAQVESSAGFSFSLQRCSASGGEITCDLLITNTREDRWLTICARCFGNASRVIDVDGDEYHAELATLGSSRATQAKASLASGVPLKASVTFTGVKPTSGLKLLEIGFRLPLANDHSVQFHPSLTRNRMPRGVGY